MFQVTCDDCESTLAELYCGDCQNAQGGQGLNLCMPCSHLIHAGAARRRHNVQGINLNRNFNEELDEKFFSYIILYFFLLKM